MTILLNVSWFFTKSDVYEKYMDMGLNTMYSLIYDVTNIVYEYI